MRDKKESKYTTTSCMAHERVLFVIIPASHPNTRHNTPTPAEKQFPHVHGEESVCAQVVERVIPRIKNQSRKYFLIDPPILTDFFL